MRLAKMFKVGDLVSFSGERWNVTDGWGGNEHAVEIERFDGSDSRIRQTVEAAKIELVDRPEWDRRVARGSA